MDYEEKYKGALERARNLHKDAIDMGENIRAKQCEIIFPELKESEDERIRKDIISYIQLANQFIPQFQKDKWLAWLEKQGEQNPFDYENANIQQKDFAPKVEPKFKVGDWVIDKQGIVHQIANVVENVTNHTYGYDIIGGGYFNDNNEGVRLWTIADAKDGDVLIDKSSNRECPFIFKETKQSDIKTDMLNPLTVLGYCGIGGAGFTKGSGWGDTANCIYYPATKEQHNLLFNKMKEAGYEWDAEKKELIKVPKPKEPEGALKKLLDEQEKLYKEAKIVLEDKDTALAFLRRTGIIDEYGELAEKYRSVQTPATSVTAWSEEDERMLNHIIGYLHSGDDFQTGIDWLKSLKDRYTWKPSDEQIEVLEALVEDNNQRYFYTTLNSLYEQLKKLKG